MFSQEETLYKKAEKYRISIKKKKPKSYPVKKARKNLHCPSFRKNSKNKLSKNPPKNPRKHPNSFFIKKIKNSLFRNYKSLEFLLSK